jgi:monoamine oxidase
MVETDYDNAVVHDAAGDELSDAAYDRLDAIAETLFYGIEEAIDVCRAGDRRSVADVVATVFDLGAMSGADRLLLDFLLAAVIEHDLAADVSELGVCLVDADEEFGGADAILPAGYDAVARLLAAGLDIRLGVAAQAIAVTPAGASVETASGRIEASAVVVAVPLGVLKAGAIRFDPALPPAKLAAVADLGSGLLNKAVLRFPRAFWDRDSTILQFVSRTAGLWAETFDLSPTGAPALVGFNAGSVARDMETRSDRDTVASMMEMLRTIYGARSPDPVGWQVTRWNADPLALGAYSFEPPGATLATRAALAEPVAGRLFFAGEATSEDYPATVHGALLSGWRAADEVLG